MADVRGVVRGDTADVHPSRPIGRFHLDQLPPAGVEHAHGSGRLVSREAGNRRHRPRLHGVTLPSAVSTHAGRETGEIKTAATVSTATTPAAEEAGVDPSA